MPTHAYFGEKDAAQCVLIKRLAEDLNMGIEIITIPVSREQDGLARSTRNQYLNPEERKAASVVYRGLCSGKDIFEAASASFDANLLRDAVRKVYEKEPLVKEIQYISVGSKKTMEELKTVRKNEGAVLSVAVKLGKCRLIDAMML
jgi:pantoate--beta-alanine ligase